MLRQAFWYRYIFLCFALLLPGKLFAQAATYSYDQLGRLVGVVDQNGNAAVYTYDAVGNILSISRYTSTQVAVISFTPSSGPVGSTVTLSGSNFSATASLNSVLFNGKAATVVSASTTTLTVTVPTGATTGTIQVTSPVGSATSYQSFTVTASNGVPVITGYTPAIAVAGSAVTLNGQNFDPTPSNNRLALNGATFPPPASATATTLGEIVPASLGSGPVSIETSGGTSTSAVDLFIPPSPYTAKQVGFTGRTVPEATTAVTLAKAGTVGMLLFDATPGSKVSVESFGSNIPSCSFQIYDSTNTAIGSTSSCQSNSFLDAQTITKPGTNTILVVPVTSYGKASFIVHQFSDVTAATTLGAAPVTIQTTKPGQNGVVSFTASSGQDVIVSISSATYSGCYLTVFQPNGASLNYMTCASASPVSLDLGVLTQTGTYTAVVDPQGAGIGSVTFNLIDATAIGGGVIAPGTPVSLTTTIPGQDGTYTFNGTANARVSILASGNYPSGGATYVYLNQPGGTNLNYIGFYSGNLAFMDTTVLPATGTYTVQVAAQNGVYGTTNLTLYSVPADATATLVVSGAAVPITTTVPGQNGLVKFTGKAGQHLLLDTLNSTYSSCTLTVYDPQSNYIGALTCSEAAADYLDLGTLTVAGTYSIQINPLGDDTGSVTLKLVDASTIVGGTDPLGTAYTITTKQPNQVGTFTFSGQANEVISVMAKGQYSNGGNAYVTIANPDGSQLTYFAVASNSTTFLDRTILGATGKYTVTVSPNYGSIGTTTVTPYQIPADATATATIGGAAVTVTTSVPGQNALVKFAGTAGQHVVVSTLASSFANCYTSINAPDTSTLATPSCAYSITNATDLGVLPATGTYAIAMDPQGPQTGSVRVLVQLYGGASGTTIAVGGTPVPVTATTPGQTGTLTFTGTAGQQIDLIAFGEYASGNANLILKQPDTSVLSSLYVSNGYNNLLGPITLPVTGTYQILVEPDSTTTGTVQISLYTVPADVNAVAVSGKPVTAVTSAPGQQVVYSYAGTAGTAISLSVTGYYSQNSTTTGTILGPDGTNLGNFTIYSGSTIFVDQLALPLTGTYQILVQPQGGYSGTTTLTLYALPADINISTTLGAPDVTVTTAVPGQKGEVTFSATAGQHVIWYADSATYSNCTMLAYAPDGTYLNELTCDSAAASLVDLGVLTQTGTYTLFVNPQAGDTGTVTTRVANVPVVSGGALTSGVAASATSTQVGQQTSFTFQGTAGQRVSLIATGAYSHAGAAYARINTPFGGQLAALSIYDQSSTFVDATVLPQTGTYTMVITPSGVATGTTQVTLYNLPPNPSVNATVGGAAVTVATNVPGENGQIRVPLVAGQHVIWNSPSGNYANCNMQIFDPQLKYVNGLACDSNIPTYVDLGIIKTSGTYSIIVDPAGTSTGSVTVSLTNAQTIAGGALTSGVAVNATNTIQNQQTRYTFAGTAGQFITMTASASYINAGTAAVYLYLPDGSTLTYFSLYDGGSYFLANTALPVTGTYTVVVYPQGTTTGTTNLTLYKVPAPVKATATVGGTPVSVTTTVPGQSAIVSFNSTAGKLVSVVSTGTYALNGSTYATVQLTGGQPLAGNTISNESTTTLGPVQLPSTGTYQVIITPNEATVGTTTVSVTAN